jgi:hypothetical protein
MRMIKVLQGCSGGGVQRHRMHQATAHTILARRFPKPNEGPTRVSVFTAFFAMMKIILLADNENHEQDKNSAFVPPSRMLKYPDQALRRLPHLKTLSESIPRMTASGLSRFGGKLQPGL